MTNHANTAQDAVHQKASITAPEVYHAGEGEIAVATMYKFVEITNAQELQPIWKAKMAELEIKGTILVTPEGINGTISGPEAGIEAMFSFLREDERFSDLTYKTSYVADYPFKKIKVKVKKETIPMGHHVDPQNIVGTYVKPKDWNALIEQDDVVLVDTRNIYETHLGTFENALDPRTQTFTEFPKWVKENLDPKKHKKVAMFCTGGIRCEKTTSYLKAEGFEDVYHLEGGILKYLEEIPQQESTWNGECYVFDDRVAVGHGLAPSVEATRCPNCGIPLIAADMRIASDTKKGAICPECLHVPEWNQGAE